MNNVPSSYTNKNLYGFYMQKVCPPNMLEIFSQYVTN
jgi:hypothetical protein